MQLQHGHTRVLQDVIITLPTVFLVHKAEGGWGLGFRIVGVQAIVTQRLAVVSQGLQGESQPPQCQYFQTGQLKAVMDNLICSV